MLARALIVVAVAGCTLPGPPCPVEDCGCLDPQDPAYHEVVQGYVAALKPTQLTAVEQQLLGEIVAEIDAGVHVEDDAFVLCQDGRCQPATPAVLPTDSTWEVRFRARVPSVGVWPVRYTRTCEDDDEATVVDKVIELKADNGRDVEAVVETVRMPEPDLSEFSCELRLHSLRATPDAPPAAGSYMLERLSEEELFRRRAVRERQPR